MKRVLVVHYDEIAIKRGTRGYFEGRLAASIRKVIPPGLALQRLYGRILVTSGGKGPPPAGLAETVASLPGVASVMEGWATRDELGAILEAVSAALPEGGHHSFGVRTKRGDKSYPLTSEQVNREVGAHVQKLRDWKVDLSRPDLWITIEIVNRRALVATRRLTGPGGLPVGGSGRGVVLISGGIDSPVAAWMMMTRGLSLTLLHFHSAPYTSQASQDKVRQISRRLTRFQPSLQLLLLPFADPIQLAVVEHTEERFRVILYRRFMMRLAARAAAEVGATCLVTGEALGQVASQTIENLTTVEKASPLPVLRPLIGLGKRRIVEIARSIGTYDISIQPHEDCCSFLMPRHPATRSTPAQLEEVERALDVEALVERTWQGRSRERFRVKEPPLAEA